MYILYVHIGLYVHITCSYKYEHIICTYYLYVHVICTYYMFIFICTYYMHILVCMCILHVHIGLHVYSQFTPKFPTIHSKIHPKHTPKCPHYTHTTHAKMHSQFTPKFPSSYYNSRQNSTNSRQNDHKMYLVVFFSKFTNLAFLHNFFLPRGAQKNGYLLHGRFSIFP